MHRLTSLFLLLALASGCRLLAPAVPCQQDDNCPPTASCIGGECTARPPVRDGGGEPPRDAGPPEQDAGPPEQDAGPPEQDAGLVRDDAGPPEEDAGPPACDDTYGGVDGYVLCSETPATCELSANTGAYAPNTCRSVCASVGGECLGAFDDGAPCEVLSDGDDCDTPRNSELCVCSR